MKNLKKALAAVMALSVMSWSCAAFAEVSATGAFSGGNGAVTADYSEIAQNKVTATVDTALANLGTEMTFLILDDGTDVTAINEADILYINQQTLTAQSDSFTGVINLARVNGGTGAEELPAGSYPIRVGYYYNDNDTQTFGLAAATMVVSYGSGEDEPVTVSIKWGDINCNGATDTLDATAIINAYIGGEKVYTKDGYTFTWGSNAVVDSESKSFTMPYKWGDINCNGATDTLDATAIINAYIGGEKTYGVYTWGQSSDVELTPVTAE